MKCSTALCYFKDPEENPALYASFLITFKNSEQGDWRQFMVKKQQEESCQTNIKIKTVASENTLHNKSIPWDFPGGPVVKTLPFNGRSVSLIPGPRAKIPHVSWPENQKT